MGDVRDDIEQAFDDYGPAVAGAGLGMLAGRAASKRLYKGRLRLRNLDDGGTRVVGVKPGFKEGDSYRGWIPNTSPVGKKLVGRKVGDTVSLGDGQYRVEAVKDNGVMLAPIAPIGAMLGAKGGSIVNDYRKKGQN